MNIVDRFRKWFFQEENVGIINIGDIIQIPGRDYYKDDPNKLAQIDAYKEEYYKILSQKKLISSKQISFDNLEKEFLMHVELVLNLYLNREQVITPSTKEDYIKEKINMIKLQLYFNEIYNMENETIEKLIALEELLKGKRIPIVNRKLLSEKINSLKMTLLSFRNQKVAISIEIKNYLMILNDNNKPYNIEEDDIIKRYQQVYDLAANYVNRSTLKNIDKVKDYGIKTALIEKELEIYAYIHKKDTEIIKQELTAFKDIPITPENRKKLLERLAPIEKKYYIFDQYGRGIVTHDNLYELYKLKFDILTCDANYRKEPILEFYNGYGHKYYEEIIFKKFENIIMGKNKYIDSIYGDKAKQAIKEISFYLNGAVPRNRSYNVLYNNTKLALLLAFDTKNGIIDFFNQKMISMEEAQVNYGAYYDRDFYEFAKEIPLDTCFQLTEANDKDKFYYTNCPLYRLYKLTCDLPQYSDTYNMPEGLIKINYPPSLFKDNLHEYINKRAHQKFVIFPKSLEEISGYVFNKDTQILTVKFHNGIKKIGEHALYNSKVLEHLYIYPSIEYIASDGVKFDYVKWVYFLDYENSQILHDKEALRTVLKQMFYVGKTFTGPKMVEVSAGVYRECIKMNVKTHLKDINFYRDGKSVLVIDAERLTFTKDRYKPYTDYVSIFNLTYSDLEVIIEKLRVILKEEIGYDLEFYNSKTKRLINKKQLY